jgi:hypothetical protein
MSFKSRFHGTDGDPSGPARERFLFIRIFGWLSVDRLQSVATGPPGRDFSLPGNFLGSML